MCVAVKLFQPLVQSNSDTCIVTLSPRIHLLPVEPDEALPAVGLLRGLLEGATVQLLQAVGAHKVLGVKLPVHGCDAATLCVWDRPSP